MPLSSHLVSLQPLLVDALEKAFDLVVSKDTAVELVYHRLDSVLAAQLFVHGWGGLLIVRVLTSHAYICDTQPGLELDRTRSTVYCSLQGADNPALQSASTPTE